MRLCASAAGIGMVIIRNAQDSSIRVGKMMPGTCTYFSIQIVGIHLKPNFAMLFLNV
jgi:hypothetical protein